MPLAVAEHEPLQLDVLQPLQYLLLSSSAVACTWSLIRVPAALTGGDTRCCAASAGDAASAAVLLGGVPGLEPAPTRCPQAPAPPLRPEARFAAITNALNQPSGGKQTTAKDQKKVPKMCRPK